MSKRHLDDSDEGGQSKRKAKRLVDDEEVEIRRLQYPLVSDPRRSTHSVPFQQPSSLLTFSYSPSRVLQFDDSALRYYVEPPPNADLNYGYDRWIRKREEKGRLDGLLRAVCRLVDRNGIKWLQDIGIVSWRGVMTKILTAPYEEREGWELNVMFVNGTYYFEEHASEAKLREKEDITQKHRIRMYYGYAFESYCSSDSPNGRKNYTNSRDVSGWGGDVDTNVQWCSVVKTKLGDTRLVIGGEVDCVRGQFNGKTDNFVELKTSIVIRNAFDETKFEKKLLKFYFQSFLLGVPEIIVGFRTPSGQLRTVQKFQTIQIPRMVRNKPGAWDPQISLDWGNNFIAFLKSCIDASELSPGNKPRVWRVVFKPREGITASLLDDQGVQEVQSGEERFGFLPNWYAEELRAKMNRSASGPPEVLSTSIAPLASGWQI
ncbi:RAI1 like PD-XK nuclease-domain-containing protein [Abortiporus biennis]|nr:RAI1 like PD-XK nuclease-domain-containing protein [Abortiporus biennis]